MEKTPRNALIIGASGLIGSLTLPLLLNDPKFTTVVVLGRRSLGIQHPKLREYTINFDQLEELTISESITDIFCTLGTTRGKAGSAEAFRKVDLVYVISLAKWAKSHNVQRFSVISAMGANAKAPSLYMKTKGEMEAQVSDLQIPMTAIFRPSMLKGHRSERRIGEWILGHIIMSIFAFLIPKKYRVVEAAKVANKMWQTSNENFAGIKIISSEVMYEVKI